MFPSVVDGEASEITDAEVVHGADLEPGSEPISNGGSPPEA